MIPLQSELTLPLYWVVILATLLAAGFFSGYRILKRNKNQLANKEDDLAKEIAETHRMLQLALSYSDTEHSSFSEHDLRGAKVLAVDDNPSSLAFVQDALMQVGVDVITVSDGSEALESLRRNSFDCVLMDIQMPQMDGYETTKSIRQKLSKEELPILAMTASVHFDDIQTSLRHGMNDFIAKPFDLLVLLQKVAHAIETRQKNRQKTKGKNVVKDDHQNCSIRHQDLDACERCIHKTLLPDFTDVGVDYRSTCIRLGSKPEFYNRLLAKFAKNYPERMKKLNQLYEAKDFTLLKEDLHSLKGVSFNLGMNEVGEFIKAWELEWSEDTLDENMRILKSKLDQMYNILQKYTID